MKLIFPSMEYPRVGGTENVVVEIARDATRRAVADVVIMGSPDAFVVRRLRELSVPFRLVQDADLAGFRSEPEDLFVHFSNHEWLSRVANLRGRALVWCLLAHLLTGWNRFNFERQLTGRKRVGTWLNRRLIRNLRNRSALLAMDGATADAIELLSGIADTPLLAIPIDAAGIPSVPMRRDVDVMTPFVVTYVGRSDDVWKIHPARKILRDLENLPFPSALEIFTDDSRPYEAMFGSRTGSHVQVRYSLGVLGAELRNNIRERSALHISMGLSALEGALAGTPTALVDPSYTDLPDHYRYRWLWETPSFTLGRFLSPDDVGYQGHTLEELIQTARTRESAVAAAQRCIDYVVRHHAPARIVDALLATKTTLTNRELVQWTPAAHPFARFAGRLIRRAFGNKPI